MSRLIRWESVGLASQILGLIRDSSFCAILPSKIYTLNWFWMSILQYSRPIIIRMKYVRSQEIRFACLLLFPKVSGVKPETFNLKHSDTVRLFKLDTECKQWNVICKCLFMYSYLDWFTLAYIKDVKCTLGSPARLSKSLAKSHLSIAVSPPNTE